MQEERVKRLNFNKVRQGDYVLYWMQASARAEYNHALEYAVMQANNLGKPLLAFFGLTSEYPEANLRHYQFLIEGLRETQYRLKGRGVDLVVQQVSPDQGAIRLSKGASMIVTDRGFLRTQREWRRSVAEKVSCPVVQIESDVVVPVETASPREEYAARTIRPKINRVLDRFLDPLESEELRKKDVNHDFQSLDLTKPSEVVSQLKTDTSVSPIKFFKGGTSQAKKLLEDFVKNKLEGYAELRNDPTSDYVSNMSPYLHFGHISPLYIALNITVIDSPGKEAYLEELIVRRELAFNFVHYNPNYDSFKGLPDWCKRTLMEHGKDPRKYTYTLEEFERAETHDPYWNAAQREMMLRGKMHGYMRMYWGKKILEWSESPEEAYQTALYLNNRYELDGRDPNSYAGVAWCFGKHDRPWKERPIFGKIRYMNARGLKRKFDADLYVEKVKELE